MKFLNFLYFCGSFFCLPGSESGYGSTDLIGSETLAIWLVPDVLETEELCQSGLLIDQLHLNGGGVQAVQHVAQQHTVPGKNFI
jgi:hypothetical protein